MVKYRTSSEIQRQRSIIEVEIKYFHPLPPPYRKKRNDMYKNNIYHNEVIDLLF
jgi:hypothetical protein